MSLPARHRRPSARPSQNPPPPATVPRTPALSPQPATSSMHSRRSQAPAHSAAGHRCTQRTTEVQRRQLRHPSETRCQRRCPIISEFIACTHRRPSARPSQNPPPPTTASHTTAPARSTHHHQRIAGVRKHPLTARLATDARSVRMRSSDVSCVIPPRLGASDAAPAAPMSLSARTAAPRLDPRKPPPPVTTSRATAPAHSTHHHPCTASVRNRPLTAQAQPMHAAYS